MEKNQTTIIQGEIISEFELYHIQGIRQYRATEISREKNHKIVIKAVRKTNTLRCPQCGAVDVKTKGGRNGFSLVYRRDF